VRTAPGGLDGARVIATTAKVAAAAALMGAAAAAIQADRATGCSSQARAIRLSASIGGSLAVLAMAATVLRVEEFEEVRTPALARVRKLLEK